MVDKISFCYYIILQVINLCLERIKMFSLIIEQQQMQIIEAICIDCIEQDIT